MTEVIGGAQSLNDPHSRGKRPGGQGMARMRVDCVIVGGGISGLAAAYELHRRSVPFMLVEGTARFGGLVRTEHLGAFVIEAGADSLLTHKPAALKLCSDLGVEVATPLSTRAFLAHGGRLRALPDAGVFGIPTNWRSFARSPAFSIAGKVRMAAEMFLPACGTAPNADESIASFIERRFGREALQRLGEPLLAGIHGGDAAYLSMRALFSRFLDLERSDGSVIRGLRRQRSNTPATAPAPTVSVRGGTQTLVDALVASLPPECLLSRAGVSAIEWCGEWRVHLVTGERVDAPAVFLAIPPRAIAGLVHTVDPALAALFAPMRNVPLITVALGYRRDVVPHPLEGSGFVVSAREGAGVNAVTWMSSKWEQRAPGDCVLLRASVGGARTPSALSWPDSDLVACVREDLRRYLHMTSEPLFARVYRMPHAGVQLDVGHLDLIDEIQHRLDGLPGLYVSAAGVRGVGIAGCVDDARTQATAAADYVLRSEKH